MKALTLTLTIVVVAIVLLVTALVIMTIFGGSIAQFVGILNPWSEGVLQQNLCSQKCAAYCQAHAGEEASYGWDKIGSVKTQSGSIPCNQIMSELGSSCMCRGIPLGGGCTFTCVPGQAGELVTGSSTDCSDGKECKGTCPSGGGTVSGTCG